MKSRYWSDMSSTPRQLLGVLIKDLPIYAPALLRGGDACLAVRNRAERLEPAPEATGYRCDWRWASDLHAPKVIPVLGRLLMRRALAAHPIRLRDAGDAPCEKPEVSFLIGHRGAQRIPHLLATLRSIAAQEGAAVECVVVEQDTVSILGPHLPPWVRLVHTPPPTPDMPYSRSWSFNVAARQARSPVLVLHDGDLLVPADYASQILDRVRRGYDVANLKRFLFYLDSGHTQALFDRRAGLADGALESIAQNLEGGSIAITAAAFDAIGGMDESFVGWGGEDNEFWERAQTLRAWTWGNLPMVHLWHAAQPGKQDGRGTAAQRYGALAQVSPEVRIRRLQGLVRGNLAGPS
jgi:hypothetical protein